MFLSRLPLLHMLDNWLFPDAVTCLCCDSGLGEDEQDGLCPGCAQALSSIRDDLQTLPPPDGIVSAFSAFPYADQPRRLILLLKFESVRAAALPLAQAMAVLPLGESDVLVPVPTTRRRLRQRGFNQAQVLAEHLSEIWGMPLLCALTRQDEHVAQMKLNAESRRKNLENCMRADASVLGKRVLLVDDVLTTGSTASEAARALLAAGARQVSLVTAAKTVSDPAEPLFVPARQLPSFVQKCSAKPARILLCVRALSRSPNTRTHSVRNFP